MVNDHNCRVVLYLSWFAYLSLFVIGNVSNDMYLELLQEAIYPTITTIIENNKVPLEDEESFQQVGHGMCMNSHQTYPDHWTGRGTLKSPDLSTLDFFLYRHLKTKIYITAPDSMEDLRHHIKRIPPMLQNVWEPFKHNLYYGIETTWLTISKMLSVV